MVICLERGADLHMAQRIPLPLTVSCFSKIQIGLTFLVPAHPGSPGQRAVKRVSLSQCQGSCESTNRHGGLIIVEVHDYRPISTSLPIIGIGHLTISISRLFESDFRISVRS